jgi:tripartite-type tricarboxylate transporter receptor subunit TctC
MMRSLVTALVLLMVAGPATADEPFPTRPITIVNPFPPGGQADLTGRPLAASLERILKQPVVLVNKPGASGAVGMQSVAVAKPDGYTILITVPAISTIPEVDKLFGRTPTFTRDQLAPLARINADPTIVVVHPEMPWRSVKELLEEVKRRPGEIIFSSSGIYGASHVPMEMLLQAAGGHAQLWCSPPGVASPHVKSGKLRPLAVTGATRHANFPDLPTLKELGYDVEYYLWIGLFAPKNTPGSAMKALREALRQAVDDPAFKNAMEKIQTPIAYQDADDFRAWLDVDAARLAEVIKRVGRLEVK